MSNYNMTEEQTARLLKNYSNARKSWEGWCYLNNIDLKFENEKIRSYSSENEFLLHCRYLLCKDYHIELYKILKDGKGTTDNIFKYLRLKNNESALKQLADLENHKEVFKSIIEARDKFYAHLDKDYESFIGSFYIKDYYHTFSLIEQSIIVLGKEAELKVILDLIPSRDEFIIEVK